MAEEIVEHAAWDSVWRPPGGFVYGANRRLPMSFRIHDGAASETFRATYEAAHPMPRDDEDVFATPAQLAWGRQADAAYDAEVASYLAGETGHAEWRAPAQFVPEGLAAGPGNPADLIYLLQEADRVVETIGHWLDLSVLVIVGLRAMRQRWGRTELGEGSAAAVAATRIADAAHDDSLKLTLASGIAPLTGPDWLTEPDSYMIGFRGHETLWTAMVTLDGRVIDIDRCSLPADLPTWWRDEGLPDGS